MPARTRDAGRRGLAALCVTGVLWGTIGIVVRLLQNRGFATVDIAFWRLVCATIVAAALGGIGALRGHLRRPARLAAVSLTSLVFQVLYFFAVHDVGVAAATLVTLGLAPVALTALETVRARTAPDPRTTAVLIGAIVGLILVTGASAGGSGAHPARGMTEAVLSGLFYAASTAWSGSLSVQVRPLAITFATSALGVIVLLPAAIVTGFAAPSSAALGVGTLWLGAVTTVLAYVLFYAGLRTTPGSIAMIITLLEPVTAVLLAAAVLDEPLTVANVVGGALLLACVAVLYLSPEPRRATTA